jgi:hypothetical protein
MGVPIWTEFFYSPLFLTSFGAHIFFEIKQLGREVDHSTPRICGAAHPLHHTPSRRSI